MAPKISTRLVAGMVVVFTFSLVARGCTQANPDIGPPGMELRSDKQRITEPNVEIADLELQVSGNTAFALDLFDQLRAGCDDNLFFSPHSIEIALAMTWAGARNQTETDMAAALHFELEQERLHPVFNHLDLELSSRGEGAEGVDGQGFRLNVINAIWGQIDVTYRDEFLDVLAENYDAGLRLVDFVREAEEIREAINAWVEATTDGLIEELLPPGSIGSATLMVLVNAIYFNAAWASPFEEDETSDGPFHTADGRTVQVPMMHQKHEYPYLEGGGFQSVELPYDGGELSMLIMVPDQGTLEDFEDRLDAQFLADVRGAMQTGLVDLTMPRWELDGETISLKDMLSLMGMEVAFSRNADFSGISDCDTLINDVLHQAFVKVNEAGTEAAAATAVILGDGGALPPGPEITLDRPFVYLILDRPTGQILFLGRVVDPS